MIFQKIPASTSQLEILSLIAEDAAQVIQSISRIQRLGFDSTHHDEVEKFGYTVNRTMLETKLGELTFLISLAIENKIVVSDQITLAAEAKKEKLSKYSNVYDRQKNRNPQEIIMELQMELSTYRNFLFDAALVYKNLQNDVYSYREANNLSNQVRGFIFFPEDQNN